MYNFAYVCYNEIMRKSNNGFTIVEISVVVVIIGILVTLVALNFSRVQSTARDTQRSTRASIVADALEKYYDANGEYPSCSSLTQAATVVDTTVLPGLDPTALVTPKAGASTNSISCADLTSASVSPDVFAYVGDGSTDCASGASCLSWTIKYTDESSGTVKTIQSRRNTQIATSGATTLTATATGFTQINLSWTAVTNAASYQLQQATDSGFTANLATSTVTGTSSSVTGLPQGTTYYFRIAPTSALSQGAWSSASATTWILTTPVVGAVANTSTTFTSSWSAISHATSYTAQCSTDGTTWGGCSGSTASTSYNWGPTGPGAKLYFRTQAVNGSYTSSWSNVANVTSPIAGPTNPGLSAGMAGGYAVGTATAATCSEGTVMYQMVYNTNDGAWSAAWGTWSTTVPSISVGASQGFKYIFAVSAICRGVSIDSAQSGIPSAVVVDPIAQPPAPNYLSPASYTHGINQDPTYSGNCPAGTSAVNGTFRDHFVGGASYGPHPWGYVGVPWVAAGYVEYWGQNQCATAYYTSPMSPESYNYLRIN